MGFLHGIELALRAVDSPPAPAFRSELRRDRPDRTADALGLLDVPEHRR